MTKVLLSELIEDSDLYPRHAVDSSHVTSLVDALKMDVKLPPVRADKKSKRITDGWHRVRAYRRHLGNDGSIDVDLVPYKNEAEMILDAVRTNVSHGRRLDKMDQTRSVVMLEKHNYSIEDISVVMHVPISKVTKLNIRIAGSRSNTGTIPGTHKIALKVPARHLQGQTLTKEQAEAHVSMPGTSLRLLADQLILALKTGIADLEDESLVESLRTLRTHLKGV